MQRTHQNSRYQQLLLPGTPVPPTPIVIPCFYRPTHSIEKPECKDPNCICHEYERLRLLEEAGLLIDSTLEVQHE